MFGLLGRKKRGWTLEEATKAGNRMGKLGREYEDKEMSLNQTGYTEKSDENRIKVLEEKVAYLEKAVGVLMQQVLYGKELISTDRRKDLGASIAADGTHSGTSSEGNAFIFAGPEKVINMFVRGELMIDPSPKQLGPDGRLLGERPTASGKDTTYVGTKGDY